VSAPTLPTQAETITIRIRHGLWPGTFGGFVSPIEIDSSAEGYHAGEVVGAQFYITLDGKPVGELRHSFSDFTGLPICSVFKPAPGVVVEYVK
jgi:hypothetical protein